MFWKYINKDGLVGACTFVPVLSFNHSTKQPVMRSIIICLFVFLFVVPVVQGQGSFQKVIFKHAAKKTVRKLKHAEMITVFTREADQSEKMFKGKLNDISTQDIYLQTGSVEKRLPLADVSRIEAHHRRANWTKWLIFAGLLLFGFGILYAAIETATAAAFFWAGEAAAGSGGGCAFIAVGAMAFFVGLFSSGSKHIIIENPATEWVIDVIRQA